MSHTINLNPVAEAALGAMSKILGRPVKDLLVQAVAEYVARNSVRMQDGDAITDEDLAAYRASDPTFEASIERVIASEIAGTPDPLEGQRLSSTARS